MVVGRQVQQRVLVVLVSNRLFCHVEKFNIDNILAKANVALVLLK